MPDVGFNSEEDQSTNFTGGLRTEYYLPQQNTDSRIRPFVGAHADALYESLSQKYYNQAEMKEDEPSFIDFEAGLLAGVNYRISDKFHFLATYGLDYYNASGSHEDYLGLDMRNRWTSSVEVGVRFFPFGIKSTF